MAQDSIVAGPYHPAFGELVLSAVCYENMANKMQTMEGKHIQISVHPQYLSVLVGQKKENLRRLKQEFSLETILLVQNEQLACGDFLIHEISVS